MYAFILLAEKLLTRLYFKLVSVVGLKWNLTPVRNHRSELFNYTLFENDYHHELLDDI